MICKEIENQLDHYLDPKDLPSEGLSDAAAAAIAMHVQDCQACAAALEAREALRRDLQALPVPGPAPDFLDRAVKQAADAAEVSRKEGATLWRQSFRLVSGLAAALVGALVIGSLMTSPSTPAPAPVLAGIYLVTDTVTPVKLAFSSETALKDARLTLSLPVGIELMGYDGQTDLSWRTDLEEGTNVLRLPLVGRMAATDVLVARLDHPSGSRTFRLPVTVND